MARLLKPRRSHLICSATRSTTRTRGSRIAWSSTPCTHFASIYLTKMREKLNTLKSVPCATTSVKYNRSTRSIRRLRRMRSCSAAISIWRIFRTRKTSQWESSLWPKKNSRWWDLFLLLHSWLHLESEELPDRAKDSCKFKPTWRWKTWREHVSN